VDQFFILDQKFESIIEKIVFLFSRYSHKSLDPMLEEGVSSKEGVSSMLSSKPQGGSKMLLGLSSLFFLFLSSSALRFLWSVMPEGCSIRNPKIVLAFLFICQ